MATANSTWELGFDTDLVTLGDGTITVDGVTVSSSRRFCRDPRLSRLSDTLGRLKANRALRQMPELLHLCSCKMHQGARWLPQRAFSLDTSRPENDGLDVYCKTCRARMAQERRASRAEAQGRKLRPWRRHKPVTLQVV